MAYDPKTFRDLAASGVISRSAYRQCPVCHVYYFVKVLGRHLPACRREQRAARESADAAFKNRLK